LHNTRRALLAQDKAVAAAVGPIQKKRRLTGDKQKDAAIREANRGIRAGMPKDPVDPALFQAASISGWVSVVGDGMSALVDPVVFQAAAISG
jgi:hypothetical protein